MVNNFEDYWKKTILLKKGFFYKLLNFCSVFYGIIIGLKKVFFCKKKFFYDKPIISVGNIAVGGTGKTPLVEYLSFFLCNLQIKPIIISRGYGAKNTRFPKIISDGKKILVSPEESGDEPYMLAEKLKNVPLIIYKDRNAAIEYGIEKFDVDVFILDDGFQRKNIMKDINIVVFDGSIDRKLYSLFPAGILREPLTSLHEADICLITKVSSKDENFIKKLLFFYNKKIPIFYCDYFFKQINYFFNSCKIDVNLIKNKKIFLIAGIGNPDKFKKMIYSLKPEILNYKWYPDHYDYKSNDITEIKKICEKYDYVITTYKDYTKLKNNLKENENMLYSLISLKFEKEVEFQSYIKKMLQRKIL
jgi:tetraacyldisaccharide 4'-kinase